MRTVEVETSIRGVEFSYGGDLLAYTTDKMMGKESFVNVMDMRSDGMNII